MPAPLFYTAQMVREIPDDGNRYETVYGELLVTPSPREIHQRVQRELTLELGNYLRRWKAGALYASPADISWSEDTLVQPDVFVVRTEEARTADWANMKTLLLVIEVLSPSTARQDRFTKRKLFQTVGIPHAWFVDCVAQCVECWTPGATFPVIERERLTWHPAGAGEPLSISIPELFRLV